MRPSSNYIDAEMQKVFTKDTIKIFVCIMYFAVNCNRIELQ